MVTAWNGLLIASLAHAGWLLEEPEWVDLAARCARFLLREHVVDGRLRRSSRDGVVGAALGVAEDYGDLVDGLLALHRATGETTWLDEAGTLLRQALDLFDADGGAFRATGRDAERLVLEPRPEGDNAEPGGTGALAVALARHGSQAAEARHLDRAGAAVAYRRSAAGRPARRAVRPPLTGTELRVGRPDGPPHT